MTTGSFEPATFPRDAPQHLGHDPTEHPVVPDAVAGERGVDLNPAPSSVGLDRAVLESPELRVSYRQGYEVVERALELTGDPCLGLAVGSVQNLSSWGPLGFALLASDTLEDAVELGVRYQNLAGAMLEFSMHRVAGPRPGFEVRVDMPDPELNPAVGVFLVDEALSSTVALIRPGIGDAFAPELVEFAHPRPAGTELHTEVFRCPLHFGADANRLVVSREWARTPMPNRDPRTLATILTLMAEAFSSRREQQDLLEVLEVSVTRSLPTVPSLADQAQRHSTSERTLRRRIAECGTTYEAIVDGVRREQVEQLLRRSPSTLREVARRVGFADERALRRAVQRWHGMGPLELRRTMGERAGATSA
ncbi:AraC family transcriptional regulator [Kitasatospora sp. NPDC088346]|uniref:AraC family transcriptional regulator n=1 Tax=Kitasatospora sp. NPDC088346 TaxID=3364073 RepID=UPI00380EDA2A